MLVEHRRDGQTAETLSSQAIPPGVPRRSGEGNRKGLRRAERQRRLCRKSSIACQVGKAAERPREGRHADRLLSTSGRSGLV